MHGHAVLTAMPHWLKASIKIIWKDIKFGSLAHGLSALPPQLDTSQVATMMAGGTLRLYD